MRHALLGLALLALLGTVRATSHREAPAITRLPKLDSTDFYLFRSYEPGREGFVTIVANYQPLQEPGGGPNYFFLDPDGLYEIHVDNDGDAEEDLTFQFRFTNAFKGLSVPVDGQDVEIALLQAGTVGAGDTGALNVTETYTLTLVRGDRRTGQASPLAPVGGGPFTKPADHFGRKTFADYDAYARPFIHEFELPGCAQRGRVFVGQRKDPFVIALGDAFDLLNVNPLGPEAGNRDTFARYNVTALCLELPIECLVAGDPVVGAWTTASTRQVRVLSPKPDKSGEGPSVEGGAWTQVSRLSGPLFNELLVGVRDKDRFGASEPKDDAQWERYADRPSFPAIIELVFGVRAPTLFPRADLRQGFLTGVPGLNMPASVKPAEMLRLNTSIAPTPPGMHGRLGVLDNDLAGFPNGRRPGDDIVDIVLRVAMGALLPADVAPDGQLAYTDGAFADETVVDAAFPYLKTPLP
mgnify:CR=1 FL=1